MIFNRSIQHPVFGTLKPIRQGSYWRARVRFEPVGHKVWIAIRSRPDAAIERLFRQISERYTSLEHKVLAVLHRECEKGHRARPDLSWPKTADPRQLLRLAPLEEIWIEDAAAKRFMLSYRSAADKEHHIHLFFKNARLESVASERG